MKVRFIKDSGHFKKGAVHIQSNELARKNISDGICEEYVGETETDREFKELIKNEFSFARKAKDEEE